MAGYKGRRPSGGSLSQGARGEEESSECLERTAATMCGECRPESQTQGPAGGGGRGAFISQACLPCVRPRSDVSGTWGAWEGWASKLGVRRSKPGPQSRSNGAGPRLGSPQHRGVSSSCVGRTLLSLDPQRPPRAILSITLGAEWWYVSQSAAPTEDK